MASARSLYSHKLTYRGGLGPEVTAAQVRLTVNSREQFLQIEPDGFAGVRIPFGAVKGSYITTDVEIPADDLKNEYDYVLHIQCQQDGQDYELVFSNRQKQKETADIIGQLNYAMQHIGGKIEEFNARNAKYEARAQQLAAEREQILAKRSTQINEIQQMFHPSGPEVVNQPQSSVNQSSAPSASDPFDEIKKFKDLLNQGILTQEEFDAKKKQLLNL